jgi:3-deoxy-D-arabino-heptulosonate 7-phosphate (DAHP) synthase class II
MSEETPSSFIINASMAKLYKRIKRLAEKIDRGEISHAQALKEMEEIARDDDLWIGFELLLLRREEKK